MLPQRVASAIVAKAPPGSAWVADARLYSFAWALAPACAAALRVRFGNRALMPAARQGAIQLSCPMARLSFPVIVML